MKKRALILLTLLAVITIGITAQQVGRQMIVNYGGKVIATYNLPQNIDSLTFRTYNFYTVTANSADASMGIATSSSNAVEDGTLVTLTATPNEGYEFSNWTVNGEVVSTKNPYTTSVTANTEFVANFEESQVIEGFRLKNVNNGYYLSFTNYNSYATDPRNNAGMGVVAFSESSNDQIFKFEPAENGKFYIVSNTGYYIYCTYWQCHPHKTLKTKFSVEKSGDYYTIYQEEAFIKDPSYGDRDAYGYLAPQSTGSGKEVYCDNNASNGYNTWILEGIGNVRKFFISVKTADATKGIAETSVNEVMSGFSVTLTATPNKGYKLSSWTVDGNVVSTENPYIATITANTEFVANFEEFIPEYVDLGLSVKWATCNVGATTPEGYGDFFAWGETESKTVYDWSTYKYCNGSSSTMTKYCTSSSYGIVDNKTVLELEDDAAYVNWGSNWRMPTNAEYNELINNCMWEWTSQNRVYGYRVTSNKNGNSIFLPAPVYKGSNFVSGVGGYGYYWSSSLNTSYSSDAYYLGFHSIYKGSQYYDRYDGHSVRAVCE